MDRPSARVEEVEAEVFNLFCDLDVPDHLLDYPLYYCSGKDGWVKSRMDGEKEGMELILKSIIKHVPAPRVGEGSTFQMLVSQIESHPYFGKVLIGKIH